MYLRNKYVWMKNQGWSVFLVSALKDQVYIPELKQFDLFIPELDFPFYVFSKKKQKEIINVIIDRILDIEYDEIIIESSCIPGSTWGEEIARICNAHHFCYLLQENNAVTSVYLQDFFLFKYKRRELASITKQSIYDMFEPFAPISMEQSSACHLPAYCNNVTEDIDCKLLQDINLSLYDYKIGCLARLDKPFIIPALNDFIEFVNVHQDKNFLLMMIGDAPKGTHYRRNICKMFNKIKNVKLVITGYLFPVSTRLLVSFDAFFTSAGSSWVCMRSGVPTISLDGSDFKPIGILGRTTNNSLFRGILEPPLNLNSLMKDILIERKYEKCIPSFEYSKPDFTTHEYFLDRMSKEMVYYNWGKRKTWSEKWLSIKLALIGAKIYLKLNRYKKIITNATTSER